MEEGLLWAIKYVSCVSNIPEARVGAYQRQRRPETAKWKLRKRMGGLSYRVNASSDSDP